MFYVSHLVTRLENVSWAPSLFCFSPSLAALIFTSITNSLAYCKINAYRVIVCSILLLTAKFNGRIQISRRHLTKKSFLGGAGFEAVDGIQRCLLSISADSSPPPEIMCKRMGEKAFADDTSPI
jgi:hypothetical protein